VKNDLPLVAIREAAAKVGPEARRRAFEARSTVTYVREGKIVSESFDGQMKILGQSQTQEVTVRKLVWKLD
jgi:hypothetical protein